MPPYDISVNPDRQNQRHNTSKGSESDLEQAKTQRRRNQSSKSKKGERQPGTIKRFFCDRRLHGIIGISLILIAVYSLIAAISYMSHAGEDQSLVLNRTIGQMASAPAEVKNIGGPVGAFLANTLFNDWLGLGAFVVIIYVILIGLSLIKVKRCNFWSLTFKTLVLAISLSVVIGFFTLGMSQAFPWGGYHGLYVNTFLINNIGFLGALIVSILLICIVCYIYLNDIARVYNAYRRRIEARRERRLLEEEDKAAEEQRVRDAMKNDPLSSEDEESQSAPKSPEIPGLVDFAPLPDSDDETTEDDPNAVTFQSDGAEITKSDDVASQSTDSETHQQGNEVSFEVKAPVITPAEVIEDNSLYNHRAELSRYRFPSIDLLIDRPLKANNEDLAEQEENKERITKTLNDYQIPIQHIEATVGPTVTLYEIIPAEGVRIAKIKRLEDDIALSLAALGIRIIAPIPGKGTIGIEVPNKAPQTVSMRTIISSKKFQECKYALPMAMGATISNDVFIADLTKMPHVLVAGATGQGKSVGLNAIIASLLYKKHPSELKFVLIDPKMVEFSLYSKLERHYLAKLPDEDDAIITDPSKVVATLNSLCVEMDNRYNLLRNANVRSIAEYNAKFTARSLNPEKGHRYLPYIVVIVDEFADLIMTAGKEVETPIARIAQKARAVGMHMIIATQRPSTNVITGIIKANFPGRIAFRVSQMVDSKTILDRTGANQLIGRGDMLFSINGEMNRVQCAFIDTKEVENICSSIDEQIGFEHAYYLPDYLPESGDGGSLSNVADRDTLFEEAARIVVQSGTASTSSLQRRYAIGYNRAGKIMDQLEEAGIVGPAQGGKPRQILVDSLQLERMLETLLG